MPFKLNFSTGERYSMEMTDKFSMLLKAYYGPLTNQGPLTFRYLGLPIRKNDTPKSVGLEADDYISVYLKNELKDVIYIEPTLWDEETKRGEGSQNEGAGEEDDNDMTLSSYSTQELSSSAADLSSSSTNS